MSLGILKFLVKTSRNIQFTTVDQLGSKDQATLFKIIVNVVSLFQKRDFGVMTCLADGELKCLPGVLLETGVDLNV
jgi:hypothetical protein